MRFFTSGLEPPIATRSVGLAVSGFAPPPNSIAKSKHISPEISKMLPLETDTIGERSLDLVWRCFYYSISSPATFFEVILALTPPTIERWQRLSGLWIANTIANSFPFNAPLSTFPSNTAKTRPTKIVQLGFFRHLQMNNTIPDSLGQPSTIRTSSVASVVFPIGMPFWLDRALPKNSLS